MSNRSFGTTTAIKHMRNGNVVSSHDGNQFKMSDADNILYRNNYHRIWRRYTTSGTGLKAFRSQYSGERLFLG